MNFKISQEITYGVNSAIISLDNFFLVLEDNDNSELIVVENPQIIVDLLTPEELKRYVDITSDSLSNRVSVENVLIRDKVKEVLGYKDLKICILGTPAGIISTISGSIFEKSLDYLRNAENNYGFHVENITVLDQMCGIISYYLNTPYDIVRNLPVNEIYKRHAICSKAFPYQVNDLRAEDESPIE